MEALLFLVPGVYAGLCAFVGSRRGESPLVDPVAIVLVVAAGIAGAAIAESGRGPDVSDDRFAQGQAAAVLITAAPALGFYSLGRVLRDRPGWLALAFAVSVAATYVFLIAGLIFAADLYHCEPDQYECPL